MKLSASITIPRPARDVFAFISDVTNMPLWVTGVTAAKMVSDAMGPGARFACDYRPNWRADRIEMEVVSYDPPQSMCTRSSRRSPFPFEGCVSLRETDQGTIVTNTIEAGPDSLSTRLATMLLGPLLRRSMQKRLARELDDLEHALTA